MVPLFVLAGVASLFCSNCDVRVGLREKRWQVEVKNKEKRGSLIKTLFLCQCDPDVLVDFVSVTGVKLLCC